jgi:hypothetical protein
MSYIVIEGKNFVVCREGNGDYTVTKVVEGVNFIMISSVTLMEVREIPPLGCCTCLRFKTTCPY